VHGHIASVGSYANYLPLELEVHFEQVLDIDLRDVIDNVPGREVKDSPAYYLECLQEQVPVVSVF